MEKTASEWYKGDTDLDILDPDGWDRSCRNGICPGAVKWYEVPITFDKYKEKRDKCTITGYMEKGHREPFDIKMTKPKADPKCSII